MGYSNDKIPYLKLKVDHSFQKQILEIMALVRVINNYYFKQKRINSAKSTLDARNYSYLDHKDSYKFPDSTPLFENWMFIGMDSLYPRLAMHYVFPGLLKGEKRRNLFQFTFSTSRGFGFPIYFGPEFYGYTLKYGKILEPLFKWSHTVCHRANQAIFLVAKRFKIKRHHPGEYESAIISEYKNGIYKGIDTLLHGYFTSDPKTLGIYSSLDKALENFAFSYSIGDHAIKVETKIPDKTRTIPFIYYPTLKKKFGVNFYPYVIRLFLFQELLVRKILHFKGRKKNLLNSISWIKKIKLRINQSKYFSLQSVTTSEKLMKVEFLIKSIRLMEELINLIYISPLHTHTYHSITPFEFYSLDFKRIFPLEKASSNDSDSIFFSYIKYEELRSDFTFNESEIIQKIEELSVFMGKMWSNFKEKHINFARKQIKELSALSCKNQNFKNKCIKILDETLPIFSLYEIFNRSLSETIYPETSPQRKKLWIYIARFFSSRYNLLGVNLMRHYNNLAFNNWAYLIKKKNLSLIQYFEFIIKLPIWKHIPLEIKRRIIRNLKISTKNE
ncbi:MAG: hypothetical protein EU550_01260 [Promethearchaeota archaeon]|nr:MAG: hypothetical protein EU550_01260 [Candidatus Lokiarchaeota archaeon]